MKRFLLLIALAITFLSGCSTNVPDCGDTKTTSMVNDLVLQSLLGSDAKNLSDMFKVEISAVQTVTHTKDPEKYTCKANVKITTTGKMGELFGNASDEITRMQNNTMTESEARQLKKYSAFVESIDSKPNKINFNDVELTLEKTVLATYFKKDFKLFDGDRATTIAMTSTIVALKTASTTARLYEPKSIEFVSTTAQQDGSTQHLVEIQKLWKQPDLLLIELAKFAQTYNPAAKTVSASAVSATKPAMAQEDLSKIFPSKDCSKPASSVARLVCATPELVALDEELLKIYLTALANHPDGAEKIQKEQMDLIEARDSCAEVDCLRALYNVRKEMLK